MEQESVIALIKDLTTRLSAVAAEFNDRASHVTLANVPYATGEEPSDLQRRALALRLLEQRRSRRDYLPEELFHEPAWDMLLALFLAHVDRRTMNVKTLVACAEAPVTTSQRWIDHLAKLKLVDRVIDPMDRRRIEVSLSETGVSAVARYLDSTAFG